MRPRSSRSWIVALTTMALVSVGCGKKETGPAAPGARPTGTKASTTKDSKPAADRAKSTLKEQKEASVANEATAPKVAELPVVNLEKLKNRITKSTAKRTLVAVWATWCTPCIEEMPGLGRFYEAHKKHGLEVIGLSTDDRSVQPDKIQAVLDKVKPPFPMVLLEPDTEEAFFRRLRVKWDGGLPATIVFDEAAKRDLYTREQLTPRKLDEIVLPLLNKTKK